MFVESSGSNVPSGLNEYIQGASSACFSSDAYSIYEGSVNMASKLTVSPSVILTLSAVNDSIVGVTLEILTVTISGELVLPARSSTQYVIVYVPSGI
jgi:hypothetical protein